MHGHDVASDLIGYWEVKAYEGDITVSPDGCISNKLLHHLKGHNIIVNHGKDLVLDRLFALGSPPGELTYCGVGSDGSGTSTAQTQLNPGVSGSVWLQPFDSTPTRSSETVTVTTTYATTVANFTWNEMGLFNGGTNGTSIMFDRIVIGPLTKTSSMSVQVIVSITQS